MAGECLADLVRNKTFDYVAERLQGCSEEQVLQILQSRLHVSPFVAYLIYRDLRAPRHWVVSRVGLFPRVEYWLALGCFFFFSSEYSSAACYPYRYFSQHYLHRSSLEKGLACGSIKLLRLYGAPTWTSCSTSIVK